jgi:hypothetical protein
MTSFDIKDKHLKNMCYKEIGLHVPKTHTYYKLMINIQNNWEVHVIVWREDLYCERLELLHLNSNH